MKSAKQMVMEQLEQPTFAFVTDDDPWVEVTEHFFVDPTKYVSLTYKPDMNANKPKPAPAAIKAVKPVGPVTPSQDEAVTDECTCHAPTADEAIAMDVKSCEASISECTAKNPIYCPYHGTMLLQEDLRKKLLAAGIKGNINVDADKGDVKTGKGFTVTVKCPKSQENLVREQLQKFMSLPGISQNEEESDLSYDPVEHGITAWYDVDVLKADEPPMDAPVVQEIVDKVDDVSDSNKTDNSDKSNTDAKEVTLSADDVSKNIGKIVDDLYEGNTDYKGLSKEDAGSIIKNGVESGNLSVSNVKHSWGDSSYTVTAENGTQTGVLSSIMYPEELKMWADKNGVLASSQSQEEPAAADIPEPLDFDKEMLSDENVMALAKKMAAKMKGEDPYALYVDLTNIKHGMPAVSVMTNTKWLENQQAQNKDLKDDATFQALLKESDDKAKDKDPYAHAVDKLASVLGEDVKEAIQGYIDNYKATGKFMGIDQFNQNLEKTYKKILGEDHPIFHPETIDNGAAASESTQELITPTMDGFPKLPELPKSLDELTILEDESKELGGSTHPRIAVDKAGNKFIVKNGGGSDPNGHVTNEYNGLKAYRAMGVFCPDAVLFNDKDGNKVLVENFLDGAVRLDDYLDGASKKKRKEMEQQIKDTTFADIVLGNWDAAGTPDSQAGRYPNMLVLDGKLCRIDPGGWGKYRAMGGLKKDEDWAAGDPNEIFSMKQFGTSAEFINDMSYNDLAQQADKYDYSKMLEAVPEEDRAVLEKRINGIRKLAARGRNYANDGQYHNSAFVDDVLEASFTAEKLGAAQTLAYKDVTFKNFNELSMQAGATTSKHSGEMHQLTNQIGAKEIAIKDLEAGSTIALDSAGSDILLAMKSINHHIEKQTGGKNQGKIDTALSYEKKLNLAKEVIEKSIADMAGKDGDLSGMWSSFFADDIANSKKRLDYINSCLDSIGLIKDSVANGFKEKIPQWNLDTSVLGEDKSMSLPVSKEDTEKIKQLKSDVKALNQKMFDLQITSGEKPLTGKSPRKIIDFVCTLFNSKRGTTASWEMLEDMISSQGIYTWQGGSGSCPCHKMKIAELEAMGIDWRQKPTHSKVLPPKTANGMYEVNQFLHTKDGVPVYCGTLLYSPMAGVSNPTSFNELEEEVNSSGHRFNDTVRLEKKSTKDSHDSLLVAHAVMKAIQSLVFENSNIEGATKGHVDLTRSLSYGIGKAYDLEKGKWNLYPACTSESAAYGRVTTVEEGKFSAQFSLPVSRITGMSSFANPFHCTGEHEIGVNLVGIPQFITSTDDIKYVDSANIFDGYKKFIKTNAEQTKDNTHNGYPKDAT